MSQSFDSGMTVNERNPCERPGLPRGGKSPGRAVRGGPSKQAENSSLPMHRGVRSGQTEAAFDLTQQIFIQLNSQSCWLVRVLVHPDRGPQHFLTPDAWWTLGGVS